VGPARRARRARQSRGMLSSQRCSGAYRGSRPASQARAQASSRAVQRARLSWSFRRRRRRRCWPCCDTPQRWSPRCCSPPGRALAEQACGCRPLRNRLRACVFTKCSTRCCAALHAVLCRAARCVPAPCASRSSHASRSRPTGGPQRALGPRCSDSTRGPRAACSSGPRCRGRPIRSVHDALGAVGSWNHARIALSSLGSSPTAPAQLPLVSCGRAVARASQRRRHEARSTHAGQ